MISIAWKLDFQQLFPWGQLLIALWPEGVAAHSYTEWKGQGKNYILVQSGRDNMQENLAPGEIKHKVEPS